MGKADSQNVGLTCLVIMLKSYLSQPVNGLTSFGGEPSEASVTCSVLYWPGTRAEKGIDPGEPLPVAEELSRRRPELAKVSP
jgi:hypothetical protein